MSSSAPMVQTKSQAVTAGAQLLSPMRPGLLHLVKLTGGSAAATLAVYDATASAVNQIDELAAPIGTVAWYDWLGSLEFRNGLWVVVTGTGAVARCSWE